LLQRIHPPEYAQFGVMTDKSPRGHPIGIGAGIGGRTDVEEPPADGGVLMESISDPRMDEQ